jgi:hypothetical protein
MILAHVLLPALLATTAAPRQDPFRVEQIARSGHPRLWGAGPELHVDLPYFDAEDHLRWDGTLVADAGPCTPDAFGHDVPANARCERRTVLRTPRVDECRCLVGAPVVTRSAVLYIGLDEALRERWRRPPATFRSTPRDLAGAHASGLVFADGEVWSPVTGATVRSATRDRGLSRSCWLPERDAFLEVDADVTLVRTRGGIYLRSRGGGRTLVLPVERKPIGHWTVEDLEPVPGTSLVLLGERFVIRGPGAVRFTVLDLSTRSILFRRELDPHHLIGPVRVLAGRDGHVGFSYLDENAGEWVLHHFRLPR